MTRRFRVGAGAIVSVWATLALVAALAVLLTPPVSRLRSGAVSYLAYEPDGVGRFVRVVGPHARGPGSEPWLGDSDVNPACRAALVAAEDGRFYRHLGVDRERIGSALRRNLAHRRIVWGGSTITQQLVKNLLLDRERSLGRKLRELLGALWLDRILSKDRQLTWYLNVAEFGPRVYGLRAAAERYFARPARELSLAQCVALFATLPDPVRSHTSLAGGRVSARIAARRSAALRALERTRALPLGEIAAARAELGLGSRASPRPVSAPRRAP